MYLIKTIRALVFRALTLALAAAALSSCFAFDDNSVTARENADDSVKISYLGKGYAVGVAFYGDLFRVEAPEDFTYDLVVLTAGAYNQYGSASALVNRYTESLVRTLEMNHTNLEDYLLHGNYNNGEQILPRGDYTVYAIGIDMDGKPTGALYSKPFTVKSYVDFKLDGKLERQFDWDAVYLGRYQSTDYDGNPIYCDRISSDCDEETFYYHVISAPGALKTDQELLNAFEKGCGLDDLKGAKGLLEWYKLLAPEHDYRIGLDALAARGFKDKDNGYMDYTIGKTGLFDVYTVEIMLDGHISGRYGKTTLNISGSPDLANPQEVAKGRLKRKMGL